MKRLVGILGLFLLVPFLSNAQILKPVHWSFSQKKMGANQYIIHLKATINPGWHIYAMDAGEGPIPTSFNFEKNSNLTFQGNIKGVGKLIKRYDNAFGAELKFYENEVDFVQYVEARPGAKNVTGTLEFMVCNDKECLPPKEEEFNIAL